MVLSLVPDKEKPYRWFLERRVNYRDSGFNGDTDRVYNRFWERVLPESTDGEECWVWTGTARNRNGTFTFNVNRCCTTLLQAMARLFFAQYDKDKYRPYRTCDNVSCCNPNHIYLHDVTWCVLGHENPPRTSIGECKVCKAARDALRGTSRGWNPKSNEARRKRRAAARSGGAKAGPSREVIEKKLKDDGLTVFGDKPPTEKWVPASWRR